MTSKGNDAGVGRPAFKWRRSGGPSPALGMRSGGSLIRAHEGRSKYRLPLFLCRVPAGFPSPAEDFVEKRIDANDLVIDNPTSTFFLRVAGESMRDAGIYSGDHLVVDRSRRPARGDIVVVAVDDEFTVKRLEHAGGRPVLRAANPEYSDIEVGDHQCLELFGVVTSVIRRLV